MQSSLRLNGSLDHSEKTLGVMVSRVMRGKRTATCELIEILPARPSLAGGGPRIIRPLTTSSLADIFRALPIVTASFPSSLHPASSAGVSDQYRLLTCWLLITFYLHCLTFKRVDMNGDTYSSRGKTLAALTANTNNRRLWPFSRLLRELIAHSLSTLLTKQRDERRDRRRSRSPHHGSRGSRRDLEADSYSSSRDYRAREREDRYSSRRDDREWDRDRGDRRRREYDDRSSRRDRDRDLFDDRSRRDGRDRDRERDRGDRDRRDRKRTDTPPRKREPTPDLTGVSSVLERKRRLTQWDIKPPGYENITAEQAKLSGECFHF